MLEQSRETNLLIPSKRASPHKFEERLNCLTARGGTAIYGLYRYVPLLMVWFSSSLLWDRICIVNQRVWV